LLSGIEPGIVDLILRGAPQVKIAGETIFLIGHSATLTPVEIASRDKLEALYRAAGFQPPALEEAFAATGLSAPRGRTQLEALVKAKKLVKVSGELIFHQDVLEHVKRSLALHKGRKFSVPEFKEWTNVSRKFAIPLLEFLDRERVTRRDGDGRIVL
jgi:selenocysteine-specific elongation factor